MLFGFNGIARACRSREGEVSQHMEGSELVSDIDTESRARPDTSTEARNLEVVAEAVTYWNAHDLDSLLELYDEQIVWYNAALEETYRGHQEVRTFLGAFLGGFPDLTFTVVSRFARGDEVSERWRIEGTHLGTFIGIPATRRRMRLDGLSSIRMREGKFLQDNFFFDSMSAMRQLGIMPSLQAVQSLPGRLMLKVIVGGKRLLGG
jgi:steroid delta-isomerase-like uncharacterized protein